MLSSFLASDMVTLGSNAGVQSGRVGGRIARGNPAQTQLCKFIFASLLKSFNRTWKYKKFQGLSKDEPTTQKVMRPIKHILHRVNATKSKNSKETTAKKSPTDIIDRSDKKV